MTDRPRCYNRPKFADLIHHGKGQDGQPTRTVIPHRMSQGCGSFKDVQKFDGTNPVPRPIFEGWACAGCVWHPNARKATPKPTRPRSAVGLNELLDRLRGSMYADHIA